MIHRFVIMTFKPEQVDEFIAIFDDSKLHIRNFPGCEGLKLLRTTHLENQLSTFSLWRSELALEAYRHSALFEQIWKKTKVLFSQKPIAFSTLVERDVVE